MEKNKREPRDAQEKHEKKGRKKELSKENQEFIKTCMNREPHHQNIQISAMDTQMKDKTIIINPEYQRNFVLNNKEASKYVESVFIGCCIPEIQMYQENNSGDYEILDGQQRVLSLLKFLNNQYPLEGLQELKFLNGYYHKDLPSDICKKFNSYSLTVKIMKNSTVDDNYKFLVFARVNKGNKPLNLQELRNCVYSGKIIDLAKKLANRNEIIRYLPEIITDKRFLRTEFILRMLAHGELFNEMKATSDQNINYFLSINRDISDDEVSRYEKKIISCFSIIGEYIGVEPFAKNKKTTVKNNRGRSPANCSRTDMEALFLTLYRFFSKQDIMQNADKIKKGIAELMVLPEYRGDDKKSNNRLNIKNKTMFMYEMISEIVKENNCEEASPESEKNENRRFFSAQEKLKIWKQSKDKETGNVICNICNNSIIDYNLSQVDHIVPFSKGGRTVIENAQISHRLCNQVKGNSYLDKDGYEVVGFDV